MASTEVGFNCYMLHLLCSSMGHRSLQLGASLLISTSGVGRLQQLAVGSLPPCEVFYVVLGEPNMRLVCREVSLILRKRKVQLGSRDNCECR